MRIIRMTMRVARNRPPSDSRRGWRTLVGLGLSVTFALVAVVISRRGARFPGAFVPLVMTGVLLLNAAWWLRADLRIRRGAGSAARRRIGRGALAMYVLLMCVPPVGSAMSLLEWRQMPAIAAMWAQVWHMSLFFLVPLGAGAGLIVWATRRIRREIAARRGHEDPPEPGRRAFLQQALVAGPILLAGAGAGGGLYQNGRFERRRYTVSLPALPKRLSGLTITHLSDFHVGRLFRRDHLCRAIDAANAFDSDIVVVTGDVIDNSNAVLPETIEALRHLRHRHGLYLCLGNHDLIDDGEVYVREMLRAGLTILLSENRLIEIGGERLCVGGLGWSHHDSRPPGAGLGHEQIAARTLAGRPPETFTIALAHHPHAFDALARAAVALTLSGHTHGGQLMLTPPGQRPFGAGNLLFRYIRGYYTKAPWDTSRARPLAAGENVHTDSPLLFVNAGVGNWFPFRIHAPAEIVQIRLV